MPSANNLSVLPHTDGSAIYSANGFAITGSVYGPIEPLRRDEQPEECVVEVFVRPASGPGGVRERHLETLVKSTLRAVLILTDHPRCLIQVTLQVVEVPDTMKDATQADSFLPVIPALLCTAQLALVDAGLPLRTTFASTLVVAFGGTKLAAGLDLYRWEGASVHAVAFTSTGEMLLCESEGRCSFQVMKNVWALGKVTCLGVEPSSLSLLGHLSSMMQDSVRKKMEWTISGN
ncbi:MAG: exosome non-catalytic core subunit rrp46 [Vezdaea aestivalis]|nr:MAG: exosome non-catalytic core subunit rrp46 [Vezdaea aestivalis]